MNLYVTTYGCKVGVNGGKIFVEGKDFKNEYPIELVERLCIGPGTSITSSTVKALAEDNKNIFWVSSTGKTFASIINPEKERMERQKIQFALIDDHDFTLNMGKRIIKKKIEKEIDEIVLLYGERITEPVFDKLNKLHQYVKEVDYAKSVDIIEGIEGYSAKIYYSLLMPFVPKEFGFERRTKQPPKDCFSAAISFAYSLLYNDFIAAAQTAGLCPYIGIMHKLKATHCALASDLMEEYRSDVCDNMILTMISDEKLTVEDFAFNEDGSVYLSKEGNKKVISAYETLVTSQKTFSLGNGRGNTYRDAFSARVYEFIEAIMNHREEFFMRECEQRGVTVA